MQFFNDLIYKSNVVINEIDEADEVIQTNIVRLAKSAALKRDPDLMTELLVNLYAYGLDLGIERRDEKFIEEMEKSLGFF